MAINDFIKANDLPDVKRLGKIKGITYYIDKNHDLCLSFP